MSGNLDLNMLLFRFKFPDIFGEILFYFFSNSRSILSDFLMDFLSLLFLFDCAETLDRFFDVSCIQSASLVVGASP